MLDNRELDRRTLICSGKNKRHFFDVSMVNIATLLAEMISKDRKRSYVAVSNNLSRGFCVLSIVEGAVCIHTFRTSFQKH